MQGPSRSIGRFWPSLIALACLVSALTVLRATSRGVGLSPDSLEYLAASVSAATGDGLTSFGWDATPTAMTHYPPGYPLLLAAATRVGWPVQRVVRYSNVVLFTLTIVLVAVISRRITPEPPWAAPIAACGCAIAFDLVVVHSMAWSEPLYLTLTVGGLLALSVAVARSSMRLLVLAGAAAGAAAVVRYVGVANIAVTATAVVLWWPARGWKRIRVAGAIFVLATLPLLTAFVLGAGASSAPVANRQLVWHPIGLADLRLAAAVVGKWVTPLTDANYVSVVWLAALAVLVGVVVTRRARQRPRATEWSVQGRILTRVLLLYAATYMAVLVMSMSLVDAQTLFEPRLLVPLLVVVIVLAIAWLARQTRSGGFVRVATGAILALLLGANMMRLLPWLREAHRHGLALRRLDPSAEALVDATRRLPTSARVYSNDPYLVRVQTKHMAAGLPRERNPNSLLPNSRHAEQVQAICDSAVSRPTFLVMFDLPTNGDSTAQATTAARSGDVARLMGGAIIRVRPGCAS